MKRDWAGEEKQLIAVVDDNASIRNSTRRLIRSFGFRAESFASASEFLGSPHLGECKCLILDLRMPRIDGLELQRQLAKIRPFLSIVFLTARGNEEEQKTALAAGAVAFLRKPILAETLLKAINEALLRGSPEGNKANQPLK